MRQLNIKIETNLKEELKDWCKKARQNKSNVISIAIRQFLVSSTADSLMDLATPPKSIKPSPLVTQSIQDNEIDY